MCIFLGQAAPFNGGHNSSELDPSIESRPRPPSSIIFVDFVQGELRPRTSDRDI